MFLLINDDGKSNYMLMLVAGNTVHWVRVFPHVVGHWEKRSSLCGCIYPFAACPHCHFKLGCASREIIRWNV